MANKKVAVWVGSAQGSAAYPRDAGQSGDPLALAGEVTIVSSIFAGVWPQPLGGIEVGRVRRELVL